MVRYEAADSHVDGINWQLSYLGQETKLLPCTSRNSVVASMSHALCAAWMLSDFDKEIVSSDGMPVQCPSFCAG